MRTEHDSAVEQRLVVELKHVPSDEVLAVSDGLEGLVGVQAVSWLSPEGPGRIGVGEVTVVLLVVLLAAQTAEVVAHTTYELVKRFSRPVLLDWSGEEPIVYLLEEAPGLRGSIIIKSKDGESVTVQQPAEPTALAERLSRLSPDS